MEEIKESTNINNYKGPLINHVEKPFTARDNLGIEGIANTISADLCPIVNIVTPRPFYWAFMTWAYWKNYQLTNEKDDTKVRLLIKKTNYFFALGNYLSGERITDNFIGQTSIDENYRNNRNVKEYKYDLDYIKDGNHRADYLSTMGYYPPGLETLYLAVTKDNEGKEYSQHHLTPRGEKLAIAFEKTMQETEYGRSYINVDLVPEEVLVELGRKIDIRLTAFPECRELLEEYLFDKSKDYMQLSNAKDYICTVMNDFGLNELNLQTCRKRFFDSYSPRGERNAITESLLGQAKGWEIVIGRQYLTSGLSIIWKSMLDLITTPKTKETWIRDCIDMGFESIDLSQNLIDIIGDYTLNSEGIEDMIKKSRDIKSLKAIECGVIVILSVYNRFNNRTDYSDKENDFLNLGNNSSFSLNDLTVMIDEFLKKPFGDFVYELMDSRIIEQHLNTAFSKMLQGRDGYYIDELDGRYLLKREFDWGFQGNRMVQLLSVMKDLRIV